MLDFRDWMVRCVWLAGVFLLGSAVFGSLWTGLYGLGDVAGAAVCRGIFWGFVACWSLNTVALIGLLTAHVLTPSPIPIELPKDNRQ